MEPYDTIAKTIWGNDRVRSAIRRCENCDYAKRRDPAVIRGRPVVFCIAQRCHVACEGQVCHLFQAHDARRRFCGRGDGDRQKG